eukprot:TRINITY_DN3689_c4_g1_i1.p1 TRINITY_DN3689_c4_g1~~TRINITY_DN3689_c4_g1_i1.p1  ORF type:complete len:307 (+),score=47.18 TRINITY_DN3689_c4_g1_i1:78-998(+)
MDVADSEPSRNYEGGCLRTTWSHLQKVVRGHCQPNNINAMAAPTEAIDEVVVEADPQNAHQTSRSLSISSSIAATPKRSPALEALCQVIKEHRASLNAISSDLAWTLWQSLEELKASDVCVSEKDVAPIVEQSGIGYQEVYHSDDLTLCIFLLRKGSVIPLHDHPGMHVFGRLLFGKMLVSSYDLEPNSDATAAFGGHHGQDFGTAPKARKQCWARYISQQVFGPGPQTYGLSPSKGNIHQIVALEDSAFFDIVTPPYDASLGRDCTYYTVCEGGADPNSRCLLEVFKPRNFTTQMLEYAGPPVLL